MRGKAAKTLEQELKRLFISCLGARTEAKQSEDSEKRVASTFGELAGSHQVTESGTFAICRWSILCRCWWYRWSKIVYWIGSVNLEREFHYDSQVFWIGKHNKLLYPMVGLVIINIWCLNIDSSILWLYLLDYSCCCVQYFDWYHSIIIIIITRQLWNIFFVHLNKK